MRFIFNNILFDDDEDSYFLSNYDENKKNLPNPLIYKLDFHNLTVEMHDIFEDSTEIEGGEKQDEQEKHNNLNSLSNSIYNQPVISLTLNNSSLSF